MRHQNFWNIFILSDKKKLNRQLKNFLKSYKGHQITFIPTAIHLFDVFELDPDIVIMDEEASQVARCYRWVK